MATDMSSSDCRRTEATKAGNSACQAEQEAGKG